MTTKAVLALSPLQYTIRGIPVNVDNSLRAEASRRKLSFNQLVVDELTKIAGVTGRNYRSLDSIAGKWETDQEFDGILEEQRKIDETLWK